MPHDEHMFLPGKVMKTSFKQGEAGEVTLEDGKVSMLADGNPLVVQGLEEEEGRQAVGSGAACDPH